MTTTATKPKVDRASRVLEKRSVRGRKGQIQWKAYLYILPALIVFMAFIGIPLMQTAWYSLWDWNGLSAASWVGLGNYVEILTDPGLLGGFAHVGILIVFYALIPVSLALVLTVLMSRASRMRGAFLFRSLLFLPQVVPTVVVASVWVSIYAPNGLLNQVIRFFGVNDPATAWLGAASTALPAVGMIGTWLGIGLCLVLFVSGVSSIPTDLYESARLDGAGVVREFFSITLPGLRGHIAVALTLTATTALKSFDIVYVTTRGGPGTATTVPAYEIYNRAFGTNQVGSAAAIAIVLTAFILVVTIAISKIQPKEPQE